MMFLNLEVVARHKKGATPNGKDHEEGHGGEEDCHCPKDESVKEVART